MALTFPLSLDDFFAGLQVVTATFYPPDAIVMNMTAGGEVLTANNGTQLWEGEIGLRRRYHADQAQVEAMLSVLRNAGRSFYAYPITRAFPKADPDGMSLGTFVPKVLSINANNREMTLQGLPAGYVLSPGDCLSINTAAPIKTAFHQVVVGGAANGIGVLTIEVTPFIRPMTLAGQFVILRRPVCKAVMIPGTYQPGQSAGIFTGGATFRFRQTLRA